MFIERRTPIFKIYTFFQILKTYKSLSNLVKVAIMNVFFSSKYTEC